MRGTAICRLGLFFIGCLAGCVTTESAALAPPGPTDPFVEEILKQDFLYIKQDGKDVKTDPPQVKPDVVLREIPLKTPLADAQAFMERHTFSCQGGVKDNYQTCLYCTAYRRKTKFVADRVVVKLYYENKRVTGVLVTVENGVKRGTGLWSDF
jgi:hypothetical protein